MPWSAGEIASLSRPSGGGVEGSLLLDDSSRAPLLPVPRRGWASLHPPADFFAPRGPVLRRRPERDGAIRKRFVTGRAIPSRDTPANKTEREGDKGRLLAGAMEGVAALHHLCQVNPWIGESSPRATIRRLDPRQSPFRLDTSRPCQVIKPRRYTGRA